MNKPLTWAFLLFFSPVYGQTYLMNGTPVASCSGNFYDSGGSGGNYSNNQNLSTTICPDNGQFIRLSFNDLQLAPGDELCFLDGSNVFAPVLACSGDFAAGQPFAVQASVNNPGGCLTLTFTSNASGTAPGWEAALSCEMACLLPAPANLRLVEMANGNMVWTWDPVSLAQIYEVSVNGSAWIPSNGALSHTVSGLIPGDIVVIEIRAVSAITGCLAVSLSASNIYINCMLEAGIDAIDPASCADAADGSVLVIVNGAMGTVQYFADNNPMPFSSGNFVDFFSPGDHIVIAQDASGCHDTVSFSIDSPPPLVAVIDTIRDAKCFGGDDGVIGADGSGGTPPYTYAWRACQGGPIMPGQIIQDIFAGCYAVTITDDNGCTAVAQDSVRQGIKYKFSVSQDSVTCFGTLTGKATITASGAQPPYTYLWDNGDTTPSADSLTAGLHSVSVTDAAGCTAVTLVEVKEPKRLVIDSIQTISVACFGGNTGSASVFTQGGVMPYAFNWNGMKTGQSLTGLTAGAYTVTVSDNNGCTAVSSTLVGEPPGITIGTTLLRPETCAGACNGGINLNASGGVSPYAIAWDKPVDPPGNFMPQNLCPGAYRATVTDANGCTKTILSTVQPATPIVAQLTVQGPSCAGDQNGRLSAQVSGGAMPYQYAWSNGMSGNTIQNLSCGIFTVTITDSLNCAKTLSDTLPCPAPVVLDSIIPRPVRCFGEANGAAQVYARGGTGALQYLWSDPNQQLDPLAVNLPQGIYTVTVSDANGCSLTAVATVTQPAALNATVISTNATCFGGNNGTAKANASGGVMPYTYLWSNNRDSSFINGLTAGSYSLTVTDAAGCSFSGAVAIIGQPAMPTQIAITQTKLACFGSDGGEALATATGNNGGPFTFAWSHGFNGPNPTNLIAGTYTVTATDQSQCTGAQTITIQQWDEITVGLLRAPPTCHAGTDGQVAVNQISGGAGGGDFSRYHYNWSIPGKPDTLYINGLTGGQPYSLTVTDEVGCSATISFTMLDQEPIVPALDADSVQCHGFNDGAVRITSVQSVFPIVSYAWSNMGSGAEQNGLPAGVYTITLTDSKGCTGSSEALVGEPPILQIQLETTGLVCNQDSNGIIRALVQGGTPGYAYAWNTGATGLQIGSLGPGNYSVTVTDLRGCIAADSTALVQPNPPDIQTEAVNPSCFGAHDGLVRLNVSGGAPPYRYSLDGVTFAGSGVFLGLGAGQYAIFVRDGMGCVTEVKTTLSEPPAVEVSFGPDASIVLGDSIQLSPDVSNTIGLSTYLWKSALADSLICIDLPDCTTILVKPGYSNTYFVTVTDANGCRGVGSTRVEVIKPRGVYVPTGFSPNGDGNNEILTVYGKSRQIKRVKLFRVYDRWGELVYEDLDFPVNDEQRGWNGQFRGKNAQTGVYVWYVEAEYADGFVESLRGNTTLIR